MNKHDWQNNEYFHWEDNSSNHGDARIMFMMEKYEDIDHPTKDQ